MVLETSVCVFLVCHCGVSVRLGPLHTTAAGEQKRVQDPRLLMEGMPP